MLEPLETSNVAKYHIGKRVEGIGEAGDVSGTVVSVVPLAPGAVAGPGRLMVRLDGGHVLEEEQQQQHQQHQQQQHHHHQQHQQHHHQQQQQHHHHQQHHHQQQHQQQQQQQQQQQLFDLIIKTLTKLQYTAQH